MDLIGKTRDDYNKISKHFAGTRYDVWPELKQFKPFIEGGQQVLDWGCGNGRLLLMLADKDIHYYGVDQSQGLLKIAKKKFAAEIKSGKAKFFCSAFKEKKFKDDFLDLVFMVASFHHLPDEKSRLKLLKKTFKEMKPGARLIITVWNLGSVWAKAKRKEWEKIGENDFLIPWKNPKGKVEAERYYHHFTKIELRGLLEKVGFKVEKLDFFSEDKWSDGKLGRNLVAIASK